MRIISFVESEQVARKILRHLGLPARAPPRGPPRARAAGRSPVEDLAFDNVDPPCITD